MFTRRSQTRNPRPLSKLLLLQLKVDKRMALAAARSAQAEKAWSGARGRRGRCCFVHSAVGCRSLSLPRPSQPGWRAWCLEPLQAGGAVRGRPTGEVARPLPALSHCAGFAPGRLPLVLLLAEHLVCGETGSPGGFYHTLNLHTFHSSPSQQLSIGSWELPENKGGGVESARLKERGTYCPR